MNLLKSEIKQLVTHEIGLRVDDALEAAQKELAVLEGRQRGFLEGSKTVEALLKQVDADCDEGKYGLDVGTEVKRYLSRASQALQNLSQQANNMRIAQTGKIQGFEHTVQLLKNIIEQEKQKVTQAQAQAAEQGVDVAEVPRRLSIKERRQAEEVAPEASDTPAPITAPTPTEKSVEEQSQGVAAPAVIPNPPAVETSFPSAENVMPDVEERLGGRRRGGVEVKKSRGSNS